MTELEPSQEKRIRESCSAEVVAYTGDQRKTVALMQATLMAVQVP